VALLPPSPWASGRAPANRLPGLFFPAADYVSDQGVTGRSGGVIGLAMPTKCTPVEPKPTYAEWRARRAALLERQGISAGVMREKGMAQAVHSGRDA
jgi:hypothetical protein